MKFNFRIFCCEVYLYFSFGSTNIKFISLTKNTYKIFKLKKKLNIKLKLVFHVETHLSKLLMNYFL